MGETQVDKTTPARQEVATVLYLAGLGDGTVRLPDGQITHVAGALPGETVRVEETRPGSWRLQAVLEAAPERVSPPCPLAATCGGCSLQHIRTDALLDWKVQRVTRALHSAGFDVVPDASTFQVAPHSRRRADLAVKRGAASMLIGLHERGTKTIVDMSTCLVLDPHILALLPTLRTVLHSLQAIRREASLHINLLDTGPDILLVTDAPLTAADRIRLAQMAEECAIPRISWALASNPEATETATQRAPVAHTIAGHTVAPPPSGFLQASAASEQAIQNAVMAALPEKMARRASVVELYAGCGTLTFPMAQRCQVSAYEGYGPAWNALKAASGKARITAHHRDLNRQPVMAKELAQASAVVLDPPHAGARNQMEQIIRGLPAQVVYVSCNPVALSKDAALLAKEGYRLHAVTVIDQFLWSAETETVCDFRRESSRRSRSGPSRSG
jgi:23S rRNA (uracil1939-C5)-methyltransferase